MDNIEFQRLTQASQDNINVKIIADSIAPNNCRLITMQWTYPRFIHSEIMTHRKLSKNSASSRAIPLKKMIERVQKNPVFPIHWGKNQKGMQASEELELEQKLNAAEQWMAARDAAIIKAIELEHIGIHKQIGNRLLEPWMWITIIVSATNFENLFALRCHPAAEPHFQNLAYKVRNEIDNSKPTNLNWGEWHLPLYGVNGGMPADYLEDNAGEYLKPAQISAGRCARVSYLTHDGKRDIKEDIRLYEQLSNSVPLHASPFEHPAKAVDPNNNKLDWGNFDPGWFQFRKMHDNENITCRILS